MRKLLPITAATLYLVTSLLLVLAFNGVDIGIARPLCPNPGEWEETPTQDVPIVQDIPNQNIILYARTPFGTVPIPVPKGVLNANKEGIYWDTPENYMKREEAEQKFKDEEHKSMEKYKKKRPEKFGKKQPI